MVAKLTQDEKFVIQGRLSNGEDVKDIAKSIQRQAKTVQAYVDGELNEIQNTIVGVQAENLTVEELQVLLDEEKAKVTGLTSDHMGKTYYFCMAACKAEFDKGPEQFVEKPSETHESPHTKNHPGAGHD